jgi:putative CRISPR-associated protein (TIGR02620 family)
MKAKAIVVTRHSALVEYLREINLIDEDTPIVPYLRDKEAVKGKVVIGPCPVHLAVHAASWVQVPLDIPAEFRDQELTLEQVREFAKSPVEYTVREGGCYLE